jgi:hypothetical protein
MPAGTCNCTANEGLVIIQYKCLVPIYVFPEMKLLFPKQNYNVLSPSSYTHISVRNLHISWIGMPILLQGNMWSVDPSLEYINRSQTHECGNWDRGREIPRKGIHKWDFPCSVSNVKPTQVSNGGTSKGIGNLNSAIEKADRLLELKLTSSQFHQIAALTLLANLCLLLPEEIGLFQ